MTHPSETILKTVKDIIINGNTLASDRVYIDKMIHPEESELPVVIIYSNTEGITLLNDAPKLQKREMGLAIEVLSANPTELGVSSDLKSLVWQIEVLLADDDDWNQTVSEQNLSNLNYEFRESGALPIGHCRMLYSVEYFKELPENVNTQKSARLTNLDALQGLAGANNEFGIDIVGLPGSPQPGDPDNEIEVEFLITL